MSLHLPFFIVGLYSMGATKFDRETWELLVEYIEYGMERADAAAAVGIGENTFYQWQRKGRDDPDKYPEYAEFYEALQAADARFEAYHAGNIHRGAKQDPKLSILALERRRPKRWAKRAVIDTTWEERLAQMGKNPQQVMEILLAIIGSDKSYQEILDAISIEDGGDPFGPTDGGGDESSPESVEADMGTAEGTPEERFEDDS